MNNVLTDSKQTSEVPNEKYWWIKGELCSRLPNLNARNKIQNITRQFFTKKGFIEVETPALQVSPGSEPHLTPFSTNLHDPFDKEKKRKLYLHTSPEFAMKMLLVGGMNNIFQLARVWRNGERSAIHHPEFTMLEWYQTGASWRDVAKTCENLVKEVAIQKFKNTKQKPPLFSWKNSKCNPMQDWQYLSVDCAFKKFCRIDLLSTTSNPLEPNVMALSKEAEKIGIRVHSNDRWEEIFFRIFLDRIEPNLGIGVPTVLYDWPISMASLARQNPKDDRLAERFEIYICAMEIANGFGELTDPVEHRRRFKNDMALKDKLYGQTYPVDEDFIKALTFGMPNSSGIALGFDRLVMLCTGAQKIEDVLWAPLVNIL